MSKASKGIKKTMRKGMSVTCTTTDPVVGKIQGHVCSVMLILVQGCIRNYQCSWNFLPYCSREIKNVLNITDHQSFAVTGSYHLHLMHIKNKLQNTIAPNCAFWTKGAINQSAHRFSRKHFLKQGLVAPQSTPESTDYSKGQSH